MTGPRVVESWPARQNRAKNPFQALLTEGLERQGWVVREFNLKRSPFRRADVWHWHWPDAQFSRKGTVRARVRSLMLRTLLLLARARGTRVVWTVHNFANHEGNNAEVEARFFAHLQKVVSGVHFMSEASRTEAYERLPYLAQRPYVVLPHGHYRDVVTPSPRAAARERLDLRGAGVLFAFVGQIRRYKGVGQLLDAFAGVQSRSAHLLVAGSVKDDSAPYLQESADTDDRVQLVLRYLEDEEMSTMVSAADVVVLPYEKVTNSGSALLALSLDRPVLVPRTETFVELQAMVGSRWVVIYDAPLTPEVLEETAAWAREQPEEHADLSALDWSTLGRSMTRWYAQLVDGRSEQANHGS
ncbi:glycosyltransferase [Sanguibacter antarcticus]|uniref:Glycosyltransferase involved in cell wall biosynthesis n=1 Tax=Sanguibacter antarcticus TaxID=372484 RepID=A0A2A9E2X1_9MICO|nr:glycosyltransferase [Sanguibacter antarcticus]PFG33183.1 glycosyltransferase involved in cell wall biosynthesis [Sanguibacter antarcticus]